MIAVGIIVTVGFAFVVGIGWGHLLTREVRTIVIVTPPAELPKAYVVRDAKLDISAALARDEKR